MLKVIVAQEFGEENLDLLRRAAPGIVLSARPARRASDIPDEAWAEADVLYTGGEVPMPEQAPRLKWVQAHSAGVDHMIGHPLFQRGGVALTTAAGVHGVNISEYVLMMMLAFAHRLPRAFEMMRRRAWNFDRMQFVPGELDGATAGLVGYGGIGRQIAARCRAFGMQVLVARRSPPPPREEAPDGVAFVPPAGWGDLLARSDYVVLAAPLTAETVHLIDAAALARMKPTAVLINISRGGLVDEPALIDALRERRIGGAGLDVYAMEPLPADSPLWRLADEPDARVILTPHIAGITPRYEQRAAALFAENLSRFVAGRPLLNRVDFTRGY
jgi:phosphoglycerate dehydrogenase-like enzyme